MPLGGPATFPLSTGGVLPSFFWFVLVTRGSVAWIFALGLLDSVLAGRQGRP